MESDVLLMFWGLTNAVRRGQSGSPLSAARLRSQRLRRMMQLKRRGLSGVVVLVASVLLVALLSPNARAHFSGNDSVDGNEIRY